MSVFRRILATRSRLTLAGWLFLAGSLVVAVAALNTGLALLFVMLGGMLGAVQLSGMLARRSLAPVTVRRVLPERCRQFARTHVGYEFRCRGGRGTGLALRLAEEPPPAKTDDAPALEIPPAHCPHVAGRKHATARVAVLPRRRGRIRLEGVRLSTTFPFGLVRARRRARLADELIVWPARGELTAPLLGGGEALEAATASAARAGGSDEFVGVREYRAGDSMKWIHWRRTAGRGEPVVREMSRPQPRTLWVVPETFRRAEDPAGRGRREKVLRFAATLTEDALAAGYRVGAALARGDGVVVVHPSDRPSQRRRLLDALADADDNRAHRVDEALRHLRAGWLRHARLVVVAPESGPDALDAGALPALRRDCRQFAFLPVERLGDVFDDVVPPGKEDR